MTGLRITTPSRLHFGLLAWGPDAPRQFGGVGLMTEAPGLVLEARPAESWSTTGPLADRVRRVAEEVAQRLRDEGAEPQPLAIQVLHAPPAHVGLGTGTQISLAVARAVCWGAGLEPRAATELAQLTGRGRRSGIGIHGFARGGLIVDGGRRESTVIPPLLARHEVPAHWNILLIIPKGTAGLHGREERDAFAGLPPVSDAVSDRLSRLVLLGLLPAIAERDLTAFGAALTAIQFHVGRCFAPAQGGLFSHPQTEAITTFLRQRGVHGTGQSSWGPAIYGFTDQEAGPCEAILAGIRDQFELTADATIVTRASSHGAIVEERL